MKKLVLLALALVFAFLGFSEAADKPVAGLYAIQGQDVCIGRWVYNPFNTQCPTCPSSVWTKTTNVQGTVNFTADGKGVAEEIFFTLVHPIYTPIPNSPYYGFNGRHIPNPLPPEGWDINNAPFGWGSLTWPAQPPWSFPTIGTIGSVSIIKATAEVTRSVSPSGGGVSDSSSSGVGQFIYSNTPDLIGKYVKPAPKLFTGYVSADKRVILISSTVPTDLGSTPWEDIWHTVEFYNDAGLTELFATQEEICQRQRTLILIK